MEPSKPVERILRVGVVPIVADAHVGPGVGGAGFESFCLDVSRQSLQWISIISRGLSMRVPREEVPGVTEEASEKISATIVALEKTRDFFIASSGKLFSSGGNGIASETFVELARKWQQIPTELLSFTAPPPLTMENDSPLGEQLRSLEQQLFTKLLPAFVVESKETSPGESAQFAEARERFAKAVNEVRSSIEDSTEFEGRPKARRAAVEYLEKAEKLAGTLTEVTQLSRSIPDNPGVKYFREGIENVLSSELLKEVADSSAAANLDRLLKKASLQQKETYSSILTATQNKIEGREFDIAITDEVLKRCTELQLQVLHLAYKDFAKKLGDGTFSKTVAPFYYRPDSYHPGDGVTGKKFKIINFPERNDGSPLGEFMRELQAIPSCYRLERDEHLEVDNDEATGINTGDLVSFSVKFWETQEAKNLQKELRNYKEAIELSKNIAQILTVYWGTSLCDSLICSIQDRLDPNEPLFDPNNHKSFQEFEVSVTQVFSQLTWNDILEISRDFSREFCEAGNCLALSKSGVPEHGGTRVFGLVRGIVPDSQEVMAVSLKPVTAQMACIQSASEAEAPDDIDTITFRPFYFAENVTHTLAPSISSKAPSATGPGALSTVRVGGNASSAELLSLREIVQQRDTKEFCERVIRPFVEDAFRRLPSCDRDNAPALLRAQFQEAIEALHLSKDQGEKWPNKDSLLLLKLFLSKEGAQPKESLTGGSQIYDALKVITSALEEGTPVDGGLDRYSSLLRNQISKIAKFSKFSSVREFITNVARALSEHSLELEGASVSFPVIEEERAASAAVDVEQSDLDLVQGLYVSLFAVITRADNALGKEQIGVALKGVVDDSYNDTRWEVASPEVQAKFYQIVESANSDPSRFIAEILMETFRRSPESVLPLFHNSLRGTIVEQFDLPAQRDVRESTTSLSQLVLSLMAPQSLREGEQDILPLFLEKLPGSLAVQDFSESSQRELRSWLKGVVRLDDVSVRFPDDLRGALVNTLSQSRNPSRKQVAFVEENLLADPLDFLPSTDGNHKPASSAPSLVRQWWTLATIDALQASSERRDSHSSTPIKEKDPRASRLPTSRPTETLSLLPDDENSSDAASRVFHELSSAEATDSSLVPPTLAVSVREFIKAAHEFSKKSPADVSGLSPEQQLEYRRRSNDIIDTYKSIRRELDALQPAVATALESWSKLAAQYPTTLNSLSPLLYVSCRLNVLCDEAGPTDADKSRRRHVSNGGELLPRSWEKLFRTLSSLEAREEKGVTTLTTASIRIVEKGLNEVIQTELRELKDVVEKSLREVRHHLPCGERDKAWDQFRGDSAHLQRWQEAFLTLRATKLDLALSAMVLSKGEVSPEQINRFRSDAQGTPFFDQVFSGYNGEKGGQFDSFLTESMRGIPVSLETFSSWTNFWILNDFLAAPKGVEAMRPFSYLTRRPDDLALSKDTSLFDRVVDSITNQGASWFTYAPRENREAILRAWFEEKPFEKAFSALKERILDDGLWNQEVGSVAAIAKKLVSSDFESGFPLTSLVVEHIPEVLNLSADDYGKVLTELILESLEDIRTSYVLKGQSFKDALLPRSPGTRSIMIDPETNEPLRTFDEAFRAVNRFFDQQLARGGAVKLFEARAKQSEATSRMAKVEAELSYFFKVAKRRGTIPENVQTIAADVINNLNYVKDLYESSEGAETPWDQSVAFFDPSSKQRKVLDDIATCNLSEEEPAKLRCDLLSLATTWVNPDNGHSVLGGSNSNPTPLGLLYQYCVDLDIYWRKKVSQWVKDANIEVDGVSDTRTATLGAILSRLTEQVLSRSIYFIPLESQNQEAQPKETVQYRVDVSGVKGSIEEWNKLFSLLSSLPVESDENADMLLFSALSSMRIALL
jgi:hypothetical protein